MLSNQIDTKRLELVQQRQIVLLCKPYVRILEQLGVILQSESNAEITNVSQVGQVLFSTLDPTPPTITTLTSRQFCNFPSNRHLQSLPMGDLE